MRYVKDKNLLISIAVIMGVALIGYPYSFVLSDAASELGDLGGWAGGGGCGNVGGNTGGNTGGGGEGNDNTGNGPGCAANQGSSCQSTTNACEQTNTGVVQCDGSCSASVPSNDSCVPTSSELITDKGDYCSTPSHSFSWIYSSPGNSNQSRYQFQVDNNSNFSSPEINRDYTGLSNPSPTVNNQNVIVATSPTSDQITYNTTYYWRVKVYDAQDDSGWVSGPAFTTEKHLYPDIGFSWSPESPSQSENVLFTDQSTVYGGATKSVWRWSFVDGDPSPSDQQNPTIKFVSAGNKQVILEVTDSDGYSCRGNGSGDVTVQEGLPGWDEK